MNGSTLGLKLLDPNISRLAICGAGTDLDVGQIAKIPQEIMKCVDTLHSVRRIKPLQLHLDGIDDLGVEQIAKLRLAHQFAQLRLIDRQSLSPALGERSIS